jgi:transposase
MQRRQLFKENGRWKLVLSPKEYGLLCRFRARHPLPYLRERVAALLKIADGKSPHWVARHGLLKPRHPDTVYEWLEHYQRSGVSGLFQHPRVRSDSLSAAETQEVWTTILEQSPEDYGFQQSRWSLKLLRQALVCLQTRYRSLSGIWYLLQRLPLHLKRGRQYTESPDLWFQRKIRRLRGVLGYCRTHQQRAVLVAVDEFSFFRQPLVKKAWWRVGRREQPVIKRSQKSNTKGRIVGAVNCVTGRLVYKMASKITLRQFCAFLRELRNVYPLPLKLYVVLDNWHNVHKHPTTEALMAELGICPVWLPTYTPEANPIERLWWQLSEDVLAHHRYSDAWESLKERITSWLEQFTRPSTTLLRLMGLLNGKAIPINGV